MDVVLRSIADPGNLDKERVVLKVDADCDIGDYILLVTGQRKGAVTNNIRSSFWFPDKLVRRDDLIVVYTKTGTQNSRIQPSGSEIHFFYWDIAETMWDTGRHAAVLVHVDAWTHLLAAEPIVEHG